MQPCAMAGEVAVTPDCALDDQINADPRGGKLKVKDSHEDLATQVILRSHSWAAPEFLGTPAIKSSVLLNPSGPPRNVRFCVYLK